MDPKGSVLLCEHIMNLIGQNFMFNIICIFNPPVFRNESSRHVHMLYSNALRNLHVTFLTFRWLLTLTGEKIFV